VNGDYWEDWARQMTRSVNTLVTQQAHVLASLNGIVLMLKKEDTEIMATQQTLTDLQTAVDGIDNTVGKAVIAFHGLADMIAAAAASNDDAAIEALAQKLHESADSLGAAVASAPATPTPAPAPAPTPAEPTPAPLAEEAETAEEAPTETHTHRKRR
jgi:ribosomal protein L12E/L44/L45/RPP1/RPP2